MTLKYIVPCGEELFVTFIIINLIMTEILLMTFGSLFLLGISLNL